MLVFTKIKEKMKTRRNIIVCIVLIVLIALASTIAIFQSGMLSKKSEESISGELARAMTYDRVQDGDESTNSEYVNFDAFFLRDLDGDGYAEGIRGTCREVGNQDTLYMNLKVQGEGYLKDGRIAINSKNLYFEAAIPKDDDIRANAIGQNVKEILFNDLGTGTQKLLTGVVKSGNYSYNTTRLDALGNNINNYSQINSVTLTGIHVAPDGTETPVEKTVEFNMDWYATVEAEVITDSREYDLEKMIDEEKDEINLNFEIVIRENKYNAFVSKAKVEVDIPQLNGYDAIRVNAQDADCQYDEETKKAVITKLATTDKNGKLIKNVYEWENFRRYTKYNVIVTYPLEAYKSIGRNSVEALFKTRATYEGFNNPNEEFDNPYVSNEAVNAVSVVFTKLDPEGPGFDVYAGRHVYDPERYVIQKDNALKLYNGVSVSSTETYEVYWAIKNGYYEEGKMEKVAMRNPEADVLVKNDRTEVSMDGFTTNTGIYFSNCNNGLYEDGYIKVYNDDTGELIETFTKSNWGKYTKSKPYKYPESIDHVRVETSAVKPRSRVYIYNVKELDDEFFIDNYSLEEFNEYTHITTKAESYINDSLYSTTTHTVRYEESSSIAKLSMNKTVLSTQVTEENLEMKIVTETSTYDNREKWKNGVFLVKLPKEIIDLEINNVTISNSKVSIASYETYEENGEVFIKIITENEDPTSFEITINCNITPDPKVVTISRNIDLYAINENCENYTSKGADIYDINGDLNLNENVNKTSLTLNLVSPGTLLTNSVATNYDEKGSVAIAPQHAIIDKGQRKATVELEVKSGYKNTISDIAILGKIPARGNTYAISNGNMNSQFDSKMTNAGIQVPEELKGKVTVYYSENLEPNNDLTDTANNWVESPVDWSKVKSFLIVFDENYKLEKDISHKFTYDIEIPEALNYNEVSYSHHAVYFSLDTDEGKYRTYVEPNKLGFMIAKQFDLEITKYQKDSNKLVPQATYLIIEEGADEGKARVTNAEGKILLKNIFVDKTYIVKEIKTSNQYELNQDEIKFRTTVNDAGELEATLVSGTIKNGTNLDITKDESGYKLSMAVEDKVLPNIKIVTYEKSTGEKLSNIRYRLLGKGMPNGGKSIVTDKNGEAQIVGIRENEEYTLETVRAEGYYLQNVKFTVANDGSLKVVINDGEVKESTINIIDEIPVVNLGLEIEKIPTYTLDITKIKKGEAGTIIAGAKFKLLKDGETLEEYVSDENGKIVIPNLYQYVEGKDLNCTYTLKEIYAPEGYAKIKDTIFKVQEIDGKLQFIEELSEAQTAKTYTVDGDTIKLIIEDSPSFKLVKKDGTTAELLPGAKFAIYNMDEGESPAKDSKGNIIGTREIIDGKEYYCLVTDEKGELSADLKEGFYKAVEVSADDRYDIKGNEYYFGIGATREGLSRATLELYDVLGDSNYATLSKITVTTDGGVVAVGHFKDTITLKNGDTITSKGDNDILILKYNRKNQLDWYKQIGDIYVDTGIDVCGTSDGGVLVGANFQGTITFTEDDKITAISPADAQCTNGLVLKYGSSGELEWHKEYGGWWNQYLTSVIETEDGGTAVAIESYGTIKLENGDSIAASGTGGDAMIVKYDINQEVEWFDKVGGTGWDKLNIKTSKNGGILAYGYFQEEMTLKNGDVLTATNGADGIIIKYDLAGEIEWYKQIDTNVGTVLETSDGGLVIGTKFTDTFTLDNGVVLNDAYGNNGDAVLIKYNRDFELEWYKYIFTGGSEGINSLLEVDDGDILVAGYIGDNKTFENGQVISRSGLEGMIFKYTKDGTLLWVKQVRGSGNESPNCMVRRSKDEILITCEYYGTVTFEDGTKVVGNPNLGNSDGMILRLEEYQVPEVVTKKTVHFGAENNDYIQSVAETSDGGFIAGGYFTNTITLDNGDVLTATSGENGIILKYSKDGKLEWYKQIVGTAASSINAVDEKEDGSIIVGGRFQGTITVDDSETLTSNGGNDGLLLEFDSEGKIKWHKQIGGTGADEIFSVAASSDGGIIAGGEFNGTVLLDSGINVTATSGADGIILKYDSDGKFEYYRKVEGKNYDTIRSVAETTDGGIVAGGYYQGQVTLNNGDTLPINGQNDGLILKYSKNGDLEWYKRIGDYGWFDYIYAVAPTSDGGIVAGGGFNWSFVLDNGETVSPASGGALGQDGLLLKYSKDGKLEWYKKVSTGGNDDCIYSVAETEDEGILLGSKKGKVGYIEKYTKEGNLVWSKEITGSGNAVINSVTESSKDTIIAGGYFDGNLTVENEKTLTSKGNSDAFVSKISAEMGMREVEELEVNNYLKEFKITTNVKEISDVKGGTISGADEAKYETVMYGDENIKEIKIVPDEGYEIISIAVNDEEIAFEALEDGSYIMPQFTNVQENKNIVVTFALTDSKITINKLDSKTNEKLVGAKFKIEQIESYDTTSSTEFSAIEVETNSEGKVVTQVPFGKYKITELVAPEGYWLNEEPTTIEFKQDGVKEFDITNERKGKVTVHHYIKGTTTSVAKDEVKEYRNGEEYTSLPKVALEKYELEKDENGEYIIPSNAKGIYTGEDIEITYYYEKRSIPLVVKHYIYGTEINVPTADGSLAEDEIYNGQEGEEYQTTSKENIDWKYELVEEPENKTGIYEFPEVTVKYYYRLKEYAINTEVTEHEEVNEVGESALVKGGTISGEGLTSYENVIVDQNSTKDIVVQADEGYKIKSIKVQKIDDDGNITEDEIALDKNTKTYTLNKFDNVITDIKVIAEFEKIQGTVTIHHYIEGTTDKVLLQDGTEAQDEIKTGNIGYEYITSANENISEKYRLVKEPENAIGKYIDGNIEVIYYYAPIPATVTVHHYKEGTTDKVPLQDGTLAEDEVIDGFVTDDYTTSEAAVDNKYELVETPANANGKMTEDEIVVTYEYKLKDTSVLVHYYIEGTTNKVPLVDGTVAEDRLITGKVDDSYKTEAVNNVLSKYELVEIVGSSTGVMTVEQTVVTYYYRLKETGVIVHYYKEGTTESLSADKTITGRVDDPYTTEEATDIPSAYELVSDPENKTGIMTESQIVVIYEYRPKATSVLVHHYIEGTTTSLSNDVTINGRVFDEYETEAATDIPEKYELLAEPEYKTGTMTEDEIVVTYYYKLKDTSVLVHHYLEDTETSLSADKIITGRVDDAYTTSVAADIPNKYELVEDPTNKNGTMTIDQTVVTYYYRVKDTSVLVHHYIEGTEIKLADDVRIDGKVDEMYVTGVSSKVPSKYEVVAIPENAQGTMTVEQTVVTYFYRLKDTSVLVHHYIKDTEDKLSEDVVINGKVDANYETEVADDIPDYYELVSDPVNKTGTMTEEQIVVTYYYQLKEYSYVVNYLEKETNLELHEQKQGLSYIYGTEIDANLEKITIDGYKFDSFDKETLTITNGQNVINIYYTKRNDLNYKVNYLEKDTNKVLNEQKVQGGMTFGEIVKGEDEVIAIDGYNYDSVDTTDLEIATGENVINIYYVKRNDLSYKVNYLEKNTDKVISTQKVQGGMTFEDVVTASNEVIDIDGYNYDSVDKDTLIITAGENVINVYYVKRTDLSYKVNYLEKNTNKELHAQKVVNNVEFEAVINTAEEVIDIDGYGYDSANKDTLIITTGENEITIYYTKVSGLSYTVNYLEKDTDKVINPAKTEGNQTFETVIDTADEVIEIDGYNYDSVDKDTLTITTGENTINIYYTKRNDLSYKVNYLEKDTGRILHTQKVQDEMTFEDVVTASNEVIEVDGYDYDSVDKDTLTIATGENVINIYYTKRTDLSYKVNYLEKDTNKVLYVQKIQNNVTFEDEITSSDEVIEIDGYNYDSVDKDIVKITTGENVINIYYVKRTDLSYKVNYLEKDTNKVLYEQKVQNDMTLEDIVTAADEVIEIDGYNYNSVDKAELVITTGENVINVYYVKRTDLSYKVNYLEKNTGKVLQAQKTQAGMTFEEVVSSEDEVIDIAGYNYDSVDKETVTITTSENVINIYYTKRSDLSYKVNYLEKTTNKVLYTQKIQAGMTFEDVINAEDEVIDIDGYNYDSVDKDELAITTAENVINIYYIKRSDLSYKVNYLEKDTNKVLNVQKVQAGMTFESVVEAADEVISIDGYNYDSVDKDELTVTTGENVINIYYVKRSDLSYKVNYLEKDTNKILHSQKIVNNVEFEAVINAVEEVIDIDGYSYDSSDKDNLTIQVTENEITIYYTKVSGLSYAINYLEKDTEKVINPAKTVGDQVFETVIKAEDEVISIDGYDYDSVDKDELTITTGENVINIYYTKRSDLSYKVNYLEKDTNKVLSTQKVQTGMTFEDTIKASDEIIEIDGYDYNSADKDTLTITTGENIINIYYVKQNDLSYKVNYLEKDTDKVLSTQKVQNNMNFEDVVTSSNEIIEINGYNYDSVDKDTLTITTGENVINIYYVKRSDLSYKVNYLEKDTGKVLNVQKTQTGMTFEDTVNAQDEVITIDGYNYDSVDKAELTITTGENVINIYYVKRSDLSYKVNYLEKDTGKVLNVQKTQAGMTFEDVIIASNEVIEIDGYDYDSVDRDSLNITTEENVINIYYVKRSDLSYKVNYLEKDTGKVLNAQNIQTGMTFEDIVTAVDEIINIDGYNYDSVDKAELVITTGENVINIYYTKRNDLSYKVNYLEKFTDKVLSAQKVQDNVTFEEVINTEDEVIDIDGYNYDSADKNTLIITTEENVINIYYTKSTDLSYKVNYLEKTTNKVLSTQKVQNNMTFEEVISAEDEVIEIDGYNYDSVDKDELTITTGENIINIYYVKRTDLSYKVNYLEKDTNKTLSTQKTVNNVEFETVIKSSDEVISIDGYNYDSADKDELVITTGENTINIYYTKVTGLSYTINYLEKDTDKVISPAKTEGNQVFESIINAEDEVIEIDGYNYDSVDKDELTITTGENIINIYYTKRTDLSYQVNYLEKDTGRVLHLQKVVNDVTFEEAIVSTDEIININGYNYDSVDKAELIITTGENTINIYYAKRTDLSYKVNYLEKDTNKVLSTQKVQDNMKFEDAVTASDEVIEIDGYDYDSVDKESLTIATGENVINIYYTKRTDLSYKVNYLEKDTNKVLSTQKVQNNMTFEEVVSSEDEVIDIDGYNYDSVDKDTLTITTGENIINIYYTKRSDLSYKVNYLEKDTDKVLNVQEVVNNVTFEDVVSAEDEVIDIDGYTYDSSDKDNLTITTGENVINIYYVKRTDLSYKVNYLEKDTNEVLHTQKVQGGMTFESVVNAADEVITINGYVYNSVDKDTISITTGENVINIYYTKRTDLSYKVNYLEKDTNKVLNTQKEQDGMKFAEIVTASNEVIDIDGYNYDSTDKPLLVITTEENVINIYYTKRTDLSYKVNYLEKNTDKVLNTQKVVNNVTFEEVITSIDEVIDIDGYNYDSANKDSITITTGENVINIYYTKRTDLSYTVNYLEKDTNKVLKDQKVVDDVTFEDVVTASDEVVNIYGYDFDSADKDELIVSTSDNVINLYYTKKDTSVVVHYYAEGTTTKLTEDVTITGKVGDDYETTSSSDVPTKYELAVEPANKVGTMTEETIEVIYYYKLKSTKVIVHHYEEGTTNKLSEDVEIEGLIDSEYTTEVATDIPIKYVLSERPLNATGIMTEEVIEVTYYYAVKDAVLNIYYLEKDTNLELAKPEQQTGKVDENYRTDAKDIEGYTLVEYTGNTTGQLEVEPLTVIYYYLKNTRATVQYIDITTNEILDEITEAGLVGDEFVTETKNFRDYILVQEPVQKTVRMTKEEIVLKYYYLHISGGVIEQHIDVISGDVLYNGTHEGNEGDEYNIPSRTFTGYDLVEDRLPENSEGTMTVRPITVTYYYIHRAKVTTQYIDKTTGEKIEEDVVENGYEEDLYTTENKVFEGYKLVQVPENSRGSMTKEDIVVKYYYVPESAGVIERHLDILTDEALVAERQYYGYAEDSYETEEKQIPGYDLVRERYPENARGKMTKDEIVVTYYYTKQTQVQVKYVDKISGIEIAEEVIIDGHKGDNYTTEEKEIAGYDLIEVPTNKEGTMNDDVTEVIYYYVRPAKVITNYYDIDTKEIIAAEEIIDGHEGDEYETVQKEIKYYNLVEVPENSKGNMTVEDTAVNYYYKKKDFNLKVEKQVKEIAYNGQVLSVNGNIGKVELDKNGLATADVVVTYEIKVTNTSELKGGAELIENIPNGMTMNETDNKDWVVHEDTAILSVDDIEPGQERAYNVVMRWNPSENNLGMKENIAEIVKVENEAGFEEISIEDNKGKADLVISIKTGAEDDNTIVKLAILAIFAILGITVTVIIKKENAKK